ncbi:MAG: YciI family protein [Candidatus Limnocylindria bacterium]
MPRDPNIPDAFDVYTLVLLRRPADAPQMSDAELDALQAQHLAYRAQLRREGRLIVNGPFGEQSDLAMRGLSIFACDTDEARRLTEGDPSVRAGRLAYDVMEWWVAAESLSFPPADRPVGQRRAMPDD